MSRHELPVEIGAFARYFRGVTALLDPDGGWYAVFRQRDPDGLRACLDGAEVPPWDVVESLLHDLAASHENRPVDRETARASRLHAASAAAHDRLPGGRDALHERLRLMQHEQAAAAGRADEVMRRLRLVGEGSPEADQLEYDLAWVRDDYARATARCAELRERLATLAAQPNVPADAHSGHVAPAPRSASPAHAAPDARPTAADGWYRAEEPVADEQSVFGRPAADRPTAPEEWFRPEPGRNGAGDSGGADSGRTSEGWGGPDSRRGQGDTGSNPAVSAEDSQEMAQVPGQRRKLRKQRGARFAFTEGTDPAETSLVPPAATEPPRGARFGGAPGSERAGSEGPDAGMTRQQSAARRAALDTVAVLVRLRAAGRSGEAHVVLYEAAAGPAEQLPFLAAELHRAELGADWASVLWEVSSLPPDRLAAAAGALAMAGRDADCGVLLRQGVSRSAEDIAHAVVALGDAGRSQEVQALLGAFVRARTPEDAALIAAVDPPRLVPRLIEAARGVSTTHERDLARALRSAGISG
ncbi:hypothetical protein GCM10011583_17370 [Streptomyces camponoticapitis]|uniref:UL36 very large tegument protein n=1 Tax=Streptomyces camponoticapitis TaxID=1616125 RepID=A0ABQ2E151_9ACTN|nr:hypothetical protein [Streptomyces camponoticapitis]GGJ86270.1 hypothetical protein GCM10011583_17370 [Streptomyces camponoticapitis]